MTDSWEIAVKAAAKALYLKEHGTYSHAEEAWAAGTEFNALWRERAAVALRAAWTAVRSPENESVFQIEREAQLKAGLNLTLVENGIEREAPDDLHSWRCEYPDRYGPCTCVEDLLNDLVSRVRLWVAEGAETVVEPSSDES